MSPENTVSIWLFGTLNRARRRPLAVLLGGRNAETNGRPIADHPVCLLSQAGIILQIAEEWHSRMGSSHLAQVHKREPCVDGGISPPFPMWLGGVQDRIWQISCLWDVELSRFGNAEYLR